MKRCFEILGVGEDATLEQMQAAYEQKASKYKSDFYADDPAYAKKKLQELRAAYEEATAGMLGELQDDAASKPSVTFDDDSEEYMRQLYHKHLPGKVNRAAGLRPKRSKAYAKGDAAYKGSVLLFWIGIVAAVIVVGNIL